VRFHEAIDNADDLSNRNKHIDAIEDEIKSTGIAMLSGQTSGQTEKHALPDGSHWILTYVTDSSVWIRSGAEMGCAEDVLLI
jgi:hypothetical protein